MGTEDSNVPVVRTNKATLSRVDQQFLEYNYIEDLPINKPCLQCNVQKCQECETNMFIKTDSQREQDLEIGKLISYLPDKKYI